MGARNDIQKNNFYYSENYSKIKLVYFWNNIFPIFTFNIILIIDDVDSRKSYTIVIGHDTL